MDPGSLEFWEWFYEPEVGHIVTLRDGRAERLDTYLSWDAAREAAAERRHQALHSPPRPA
ncbi:MAG TPA: hypothetical protein VIZ91_06075 [Solirubrobacterales bacterium]